MADISKITALDNTTYNIKDSVARAAGVYYTTCSTAGDTQQKDITISDITSLDAGLQIRVRFAYNQGYNGTPTLKLNNFAAKEIRRDVNNAAGRYEWRGTETLDLVYDGTYWIIVDGGTASVSYYGVTKLNNAVDSSSEVLAASSKAIKTVNDSLTSHTGNTSNPHSVTAAQVGAAPSAAGIYYGTCDTAADTQEKVVTISGITSLYTGLVIAVRFTYYQNYDGTPTLNLNNLGAKNIKRNSASDAARYEWKATEVISLVYNGVYWQIIDGDTASTIYYGYTKLSSATDSTSEVLAATPAAVKAAYDLANGKANPGDIPSAYTSNPSMDGTASPGSSTAWAKGDHVHPSDTSRVPVYGAGENLLRNWYFVGGGTGRGVFPINQRGQSSYSSGYSIDRWRISSQYYTAALSATGITLTKTSGGAALFGQKLSGLDLNQTYTFSAIVNGTLCIYTGKFNGNYSEFTVDGVKFRLYMSLDTNKPEVRIYCTTATVGVLTVTAVKLELGTEQTLAHLAGSTWVLNEIPDYEEELLKCQTSTADPSDYYANQNIGFNVSNYNFIDNWYFINPVNQRNITSGASGNFIDRWRAGSATGFSFTMNSSGMVLTNTNTSSAVLVTQELNAGQQLLGQTVCLSILTTSGLNWVTGTLPSSFNSSVALAINQNSEAIAQIYLTSSAMQVRIRCPKSTTLSIIAIKLELGVQQTLAHIENNVWVPNEIPDYEEQLIRCQTSTAYSSDTYSNKTLATEQQLTAYIETGTTASRAYSVGDNFCWNGLLYRVTSAISSGGLLTDGSNCEAIVSTDLGYRPCQYEIVTDNWTGVTGTIQKLGNMIMICLRGTAAAALTTGSELLRVSAYPPGVSGVVLPLFNGYTATSARVNAGTSGYAGTARIYANSSIASGANLTLNGIYYI